MKTIYKSKMFLVPVNILSILIPLGGVVLLIMMGLADSSVVRIDYLLILLLAQTVFVLNTTSLAKDFIKKINGIWR